VCLFVFVRVWFCVSVCLRREFCFHVVFIREREIVCELMCVYLWVGVFVDVCAWMCGCVCLAMCACVCLGMRMRTRVCVYVGDCKYIHTHIHTHRLCVSTRILYVCIYMYICMYIYTYIYVLIKFVLRERATVYVRDV